MQDLLGRVSALSRPRVLVDAANHAVGCYRRDTHLRRIIKSDSLPRHGAAVMRLLDLEGELERARTLKSAHYSPRKHLEVMIALLGELRLWRAR